MFGLGRKDAPPQSGQQRRAAENRRSARAGQAWEDAGRRRDYERSRSTPAPRAAWWRSS